MDKMEAASPQYDSDENSEDELALINAAAAHFGAGGSGKRKTSKGNKSYGDHTATFGSNPHQGNPQIDERKPTTSPSSPMQSAFEPTLQSLRRRSRRLPMRPCSSLRSEASSSSSHMTVLRRNGGSFRHRHPTSIDGIMFSCPEGMDTGANGGGSSTHNTQSNGMPAYGSGGVPLNVNVNQGLNSQQYAFNQFNNFNSCMEQGANTDEDIEIAQFSEMLPHEYHRLNNIQQRPSLPNAHAYRNSTISIDSSMLPGNMSGAVSRKRRSHTDIADAAAEVAALYRDLSDSEDCLSSINDEDGSQTSWSKNSNKTANTTTLTQRSSVTRRSSSASTTGFSRLSLHANSCSVEERPRKRRSSSSSISRFDDTSHRQSFQTRDSNTFTPLGSNIKAFNAASAAVAADEAAQRLSNVVRETNTDGLDPRSNDGHIQPGQNVPKRKFERRAAFVVSSIETEAAVALANRTQLLQKDRYAKLLNKRSQARRSMSYSSGIKMTSSIIASALPEDAETILEDPDVKTDFMKLTRSRMDRRVLSLPDQNAVTRLSQTSINEDLDFSRDIGHQSSALSANLEASSAALKDSLREGMYYDQSRTLDWGQHFLHQYNEHYPTYNIPPPQFHNHINHNSMNIQLQNTTNPLQVTANHTLPNTTALNSSLQIAAEVFNTNALAAQSLAQTAQVAIAMLQTSSQAIGKSQSDDVENDAINFDSFDGKVTLINAVEPDTPEEVRISERVHDAAMNDDLEAVKSILEEFKEAARMTLSESETGDVALHTATRNDSYSVVDLLLESDSECALIRNHDGHSALHLAAEKGILPVASSICSKCPASARVQCEDGFLPLHIAVSTGTQHPDAPQVTTILHQNFKEATNVTNDEGLLPIHLAAISGFNSGIRTILSSDFKSIAKRECTELKLPLDLAIESLQEEEEQNLETVELLLSSAFYGRVIPRPRETSENFPFLPLHGAAVSRPSIQSWEELLKIYSGHIMDVDRAGRSIAHMICIPRGNSEVDVSTEIKMLKSIDRQAFKTYDNDGFLPLHRSLSIPEVSIDFINTVISLDNDAITCVVKSHSVLPNMLPMQVAAFNNCDLSIIFELTKLTVASLSTLR